jgi:hypothetical protein
MAKKPKKQQAPQPEPLKALDEFSEDLEGIDEDVTAVVSAPPPPQMKLRDWRDVEKLKEERELRRHVDDDLDLLGDLVGAVPRRSR